MAKHNNNGIVWIMETATNLDPTHTPDGKFAKGNKANPDGKGGFGERREDISPGGWKKEMVFSYQYKRFMNMSVKEFKAFAKTPEDELTMVEYSAYKRVAESRNSLSDVKEITDRTEGRASQAVDVTSDHKPIALPIMTLDALRTDDRD